MLGLDYAIEKDKLLFELGAECCDGGNEGGHSPQPGGFAR
jgi:hypothetical protein